ncbi:MAG: DNA primase large subunit PriL [Methanotrichaceae archaeon]|nr:DNA primase large subunit PriL [Methanotrichaceae archaeon]
MRIADYPFTQQAADHVRAAGYSLEDLLEKPSFRIFRTRAADRVRGAIDGDISDVRAQSESELLSELLSYPLARIMVSCLDDSHLLRRYALAEAKLAHRRMEREKADLILLAEDLNLHPQPAGDLFRLHFSEYIVAGHRMKSPKWKLVNRDLDRGFLTVTRDELVRLMEELVRDRVLSGLPLEVDSETCSRLDEILTPLRRDLEAMRSWHQTDLGRVEEGAFPPCIRSMLADVAAGKNLAHSARFALTSFLLRIGMSSQDVVALFSSSPDFDPERTGYQVEHIAGSSGTRYKPPSCSTMKTYGNCPGEDQLCARINHPLNYYQRRVRSISRKES